MATHLARRGGSVRLFVFDFDQTLTVFHVFKALAGWMDHDAASGGSSGSRFRVPAPYATSEIGQVHRIEELDASDFQGAGGFARAAFGGEERVEEVRGLLHGLRESNAELFVCTKGLVGPVRKCLGDLDLLKHFGEIYGNVGSLTYGMTAYDKKAAEAGPSAVARELLGSEAQSNWGTKSKLVTRLMRERDLRRSQCCLVEDDASEIRRAEPICRTLYVQGEAGVTPKHVAKLLSMASEPERGAGPGAEPPRSAGRRGCTTQ